MKNYRKALKNSSGQNQKKIRRAKLRAQDRASFNVKISVAEIIERGKDKGKKRVVIKDNRIFNHSPRPKKIKYRVEQTPPIHPAQKEMMEGLINNK
jgi:hypothetical protein